MKTPFQEKLINDTFGVKYKKPFIPKLVLWIIDSNYRHGKRLDHFIKDQIDNPSPELLSLAQSFSHFKNDDERIIAILKYTYNNYSYKSDLITWNRPEYWATALETSKLKKGDCDDLNGFIHVLAVLAGVTELKLWSVIGNVPAGGHYWTVYLSTTTDKLYAIDATYHVSLRAIKTREELNTDIYKDIWYLFNGEYSWKPI